VIELDLPRNEEPYERVCRYSGIRVDGRVYIEHDTAAPAEGECEARSEVEHYNLRRDPRQLRNLAVHPTPASDHIEARLAARLERFERCAGVAGDAESSSRPPCE
jgi:hypothetical protein